jgi:ATP-dependent HslUV protease subunit HslV
MLKGTTIVATKRGNKVAIAGDGQVTFGEQVIMKNTAIKVRKIYNDKVLIGFAGSVSDAITLSEKLEERLETCHGNLKKAAVELAKEWRMDKMLRKLEAMLIAANKDEMYLISGNGEVIKPDEEVVAIGSGGSYAYSAALALYKHTSLQPEEIVDEALKIASDICVYTNSHITVVKL